MPAGQHFVEDRPEGKEIGPVIDRVSADLFRRHVRRRAPGALRAARARRVVVGRRSLTSDPRDTKVQDLQPPVVGDHEVLGLEIHVHDVLGMRRREPVRHFNRVLDGLVDRQRPARHPRPERLAVQELGDRIPEAALGADVVERQDVRVTEGGNRLRLLREQGEPRRIGSERFEEDLDRHVALQPAVARAVDDARSAGADLFDDLVVSQRLARHGEDRRRVRIGRRRPVANCGERRRRDLSRARTVDSGERGLQLAGAREPPRRVDLDGALDHANEGLLQIGTEILKPCGFPPRVRGAEAGDRLGVDGEVVGHEVKQQYPDAVDVASNRRVGAVKPLRREVRQRPDDARAHRTRRRACLPRAEVHQHQAAALLAHDVLRLDVPVNQPGAVHGCQRPGEVLADEPGLAGAERAVDAEHVLERHPPDQFHPETDLPVVLTGAVDRDDIGMAHARQRASFMKQSGFRGNRRRGLAAGA